jgi:formylglycine-generating enzyme
MVSGIHSKSIAPLAIALLLVSCAGQIEADGPDASPGQPLGGTEELGEALEPSEGGTLAPAKVDPEPQQDPVPAPQAACPDDMVEVKGDFCPAVVQECLKWLDEDHTNKRGAVDPNMCAEFRRRSRCVASKKPMHYCVDRYEWPNRAGEVPDTGMSWHEAKASCESVGKRLCNEDEWTFACEGPNMKPYPYGDGYRRDETVCNTNVPWRDPHTSSFEELDSRSPSGSHEKCRSDFGVYDMVGNVDEWVRNTQGSAHHEPWISGMMGGHWVHGVRNRCRALTDWHEPTFTFYVTGARCCSAAAQ